MSDWSNLRDIINKTPIGGIITRKQIHGGVYRTHRTSGDTSIDNYRVCLDRIGILSKYKRGQYKVNHHIKEDISIGVINRLAYPRKGWQEWFIPERERLNRRANAIANVIK